MPNASASSPSMIELQGVRHVYKGRNRATVALDSVDLRLDQPGMVLIFGPSGSGKTSLLLAAAGLLMPSEGHVFWGRRDLHGIPDSEMSELRASGIGVALQAADLVETLTVLENVALPGIVSRGYGVWDGARAALRSLEIEHLAESLTAELSTGERRRAALARALCAGTAFVLVDEPTAHLDSASTAIVTEALRSAAERGVCILVVSHDRSLAVHAKRSFEMVSGRLRGSV